VAIFTRYSSLADETSSSPSSHYIETPRKTASGNSCKRLRVIQWLDRKFSRRDLLVTKVRFQKNPKENGFQKLMQKFKCDPTIGSKVMAILAHYSSLANKTASSTSSHYIETPKKTTSGNSCKRLRRIQWLDRKLWPF